MKEFLNTSWKVLQSISKWIFSNTGFVLITLFCLDLVIFTHHMGMLNLPLIIVNVLSSPIKCDSIILYIMLILLIAFLGIKIYNRIKNKSSAKPSVIFLSTIILTLYIYFVCQSSTDYLVGDISPFVTILLAIIAIEIFVCWIFFPILYYFQESKHQSDSYTTPNSVYLADRALSEISDDELSFSPYVVSLIKIIEMMQIEVSHSVAITGEWGAGKSSFLNMTEDKLRKESNLVIRFEPLKSKNADNIQVDFFDLLKSSLSKYDDTFDNSFDNYKELLGLVDNKFIKLLVGLRSKNLANEKEKIEQSILKLGKRIVIIVEDVDRLTKEEMLQVFRLVGYNACFPRIVYLLAMDKHKVEKTLSRDEGATEVSDTHFSEKYYEMEFPIPETTSGQIVSYVKKHISTKIDFDLIHAEDILYCIPTIRDAKRFLNYFNYRVLLLNDLDELSFFILSLIRYRNESIYQDIKTRELIRYNENQKKYIVNEWITDDKLKNGEIGEFAISYGCDINGRQLKEKFPYRYIDKSLYSLLETLFADDAHRKNLISSPNCFFYYFVESAGGLLEYGEMELLLTLPMGELISRIDKYNEDDCIKEFLKLYWEQFDPDVLENDKTTLGHYYIIRDYLKIEELTYLGENIGCARGMEKPVASDIMLDDTIPSPTYHNRLVGLDDGNMVNDERYQSVNKFQGNHAIAQKNYKYGVINIKGVPIIPFDYDEYKSNQEKILELKKGDKWYIIEYDEGNIKGISKDGYIYIFYDYDLSNIIAVQDDKGILLKHQDKEIRLSNVQEIRALNGSKYAVKSLNGRWGLFDIEKADSPDNIEYKYDEIRRFRTSFATRSSSVWSIIDFHGNKIFENDRIAEIEEVSDNMFSFESYSLEKALYRGSKRLTDYKYHTIKSRCEGKYFLLLDTNSGVSLVDKDGKSVLDGVYDEIKIYQEGWAIVRKDREWYYVKFSDKIPNRITIDELFDDMNDFHEGYAAVCLDSQKWGYVNGNFQLVVPCIYHYASDVKDGKAEVRLYSIEKEIDLKEIENSKKL